MSARGATILWNGLTDPLAGYVVEPLELDRDWPGIERLLEMEEWPFIREDFEVSHRQARSIGVVARRSGVVKGFFVVHHFGDIAYLDMIIIEKGNDRGFALAHAIWHFTNAELKRKGFAAQVAHCTKESTPFLRIAGFKPGISFTLLRRGAIAAPGAQAGLAQPSLAEIADLDARVFGMSRRPWLESLIAQETTRFVGRHAGGALLASACLRKRRENSLCIDSCNGLSFAALQPLLEDILAAFPDKRLECFVKTDGDLHRYLIEKGFRIPDFFTAIGPLVEFRLGPTGEVGTGPFMRTLSWI